MIDIKIGGGITINGVYARWGLLYEGPSETLPGCRALVVSCPKSADIHWLRQALSHQEIIRVQTPSSIVSGPVLAVEVGDVVEDVANRRIVVIRFDNEMEPAA